MKNKIIGDISNQTAFSAPVCEKIEALLTSREQWAEIKKYWNVEEQEVKQKGENYLGHYVDEKRGRHKHSPLKRTKGKMPITHESKA